MRVSDINTEVKKQKYPSEKKVKLRNVLSNLFDAIVRFENSGGDKKSNKEKMELLKDLIIGMIKDEDQKKIIRGEG
jgi:hypothetical protein